MDGIKYLAKVTLPILILVSGVVFGARGCGLSKRYSPHEHLLYELPGPWALWPPSGEESFPENPSTVPLWTLQPGGLKSTLPKISELAQTRPGPVAFFLPDNEREFSEDLIQFVKREQLEERALFLSPHDGLIRDLRAELPAALFSLGMGDTTQLFMLHALFLEPVAKFTADFLMIEPQFLTSQEKLPGRLERELHRRGKSIFLDLREESPESALWQIPAGGYILPAGPEGLEILQALRRKEGGQLAP